MKNFNIRLCPLCDGHTGANAFPYNTYYNYQNFKYYECNKCLSIYLDPVPDAETFSLMYAKDSYHDYHYGNDNDTEYVDSVNLLKKFLPEGSSVLDYGCGTGGFLKVLKDEGFDPFGVEYDSEAGKLASKISNCKVFRLDEFNLKSKNMIFDAIHLGDVLEHLPNPIKVMSGLFNNLKENGIVFLEGPLENNPSLIYYITKIFGKIKFIFRPGYLGNYPPTHLIRVNEKQQLRFIYKIFPKITICKWEIYETGWPYKNQGIIKNFIGRTSIILSKNVKKNWGNRFKTIIKRVK